ncbi:MAG: bifunctional glutamate N-acetyltransferase/amino-acid acetyltransferase ArgJ [Desulfosudaceae bacterium]
MTDQACPGFQWSGISAGIKKEKSKKDLGLIFSDVPASAAAVFTKNRVKAAPVLLDAERIKPGTAQAIVVNSGNANCCTGEQGMTDALEMARSTALELNIPENQVLVASTGVIGAPMPMPTIVRSLPAAVKALSPSGWQDFSESIMTTDRFPKTVITSGRLADGSPYTIAAVAKGAGMIRPDMATMLCFVCSDIQAPPEVLSDMLTRATDNSFNRITVDGDTSTNDTVILLANGLSGAVLKSERQQAGFQEVLNGVLGKLARMMVKDGEGATKFIEIRVRGAASRQEALLAAETVAGSVLVKTAFFGEDANWGRIAAAVGRSGAEFDPDRLDIFFDDVQLVGNGRDCGSPAETAAAAVVKKEEITVVIDLNTAGQGEAAVFTCDLSLDYVKINSDYRS